LKSYINGKQYNENSISYRELGFGEDLPFKEENFQIFIIKENISSQLIKIIDFFIEQCKRDDKHLKEPDIPELNNKGYPKASKLLDENRSLVEELIKDYLYFDILELLFKGNKNPDFIINNIEYIKFNGINLEIKGSGFFAKVRDNYLSNK